MNKQDTFFEHVIAAEFKFFSATFFTTVLLYLLNVVAARRQLTTLFVQSVPFDDLREGKRFENDGSLLATKSFAKQSECALRCNGHAKCRSFKVCSNHISQLNLDDIFSIEPKVALKDGSIATTLG